jgi:hypothetical protein
MTPSSWKLIGGGILAVALLCAGFGIRKAYVNHQVTAGLAQAAKDDQAGSKAYAQGATDGTKAKAQQVQVDHDEAPLQGDDAAVAQDRAAVARFTSRPVRPPSDPKTPDPEPLGPPVESPAELAKDRLIEDLTKAYADSKTALVDTNALLATKTSEADNYHQAADAYKREADGLHVVVSALQGQQRPWSAGAVYGTSGTAGAFVERDLGPFRGGVDVVRRVLSGGNSTVDVSARLGWRF